MRIIADHIRSATMLITDGVPTVGENPEKEVLKEVAIAYNKDITVSIAGINLNKTSPRSGLGRVLPLATPLAVAC